MTSGFYARLREIRHDDDALAACIDRGREAARDTINNPERYPRLPVLEFSPGLDLRIRLSWEHRFR